MSMQAKLLAAATAAAQEATVNERARCLWCIDSVVAELRTKLGKKLLSPVELQAATMKLRIAEGVATAARRAIVSGVRPSPASPPAEGVTGQPGTAGFSPPEGRCRICERSFDDPRGCDKSLPHHESDRLKP